MCLPAIAGAIGSVAGALGGASTLVPAAASIGGSLLASRASGNAISDAQGAMTQRFNQTLDLLRPRIQAGDAAVGQMMAELGLGGAGSGGQSPGGGPAGPNFQGYLNQYGDVRQWAQTLGPKDQQWIARQGFDLNRDGRVDMNERAAYHYNTHGRGEGRGIPARPSNATNPGQVDEVVGGRDRFDRFRDTPGYQFMLTEGQRAIDGSAASRGRLMSGNTLKRLQEYGQGLADQTYGQYFNRLAGIANLGNQAAGIAANVNMNQGNNLANAAIARGSNAASTIGSIGGTIGDVLGGADFSGFGGGGGQSSYTGGFNNGPFNFQFGGG